MFISLNINATDIFKTKFNGITLGTIENLNKNYKEKNYLIVDVKNPFLQIITKHIVLYKSKEDLKKLKIKYKDIKVKYKKDTYKIFNLMKTINTVYNSNKNIKTKQLNITCINKICDYRKQKNKTEFYYGKMIFDNNDKIKYFSEISRSVVLERVE